MNYTKYTKYTIPLLALVLLIPVGMSDTFAQSDTELETEGVVGPVGVVEEHTAESHKLRIDTKKKDIANLEIQMTTVSKRIFELEATLTDLKSRGITDGQENVKDTIDALYVELDALQEKAYTLFEIPEKRHQKLLDIKQEILVQYNNTSLLNDVFVDHLDESVQVVLHSNDFELYKNSVLDTTGSIASENFEDVAGNIDIGVKHFTASTVTGGDLYCAEFGPRNNQHDYQCVQATITFPATRGSDNGFVTVGHTFSEVLSITAGIATSQLKVFQPGPDANNIDNAIAHVPTGQSLSDLSWQAQVIGKLNYGIYNGGNSNDAAFVKSLPGKTIDREISHYGIDYDIASYHMGNPSVGHYVYKSGATTGTTFGVIQSVNTDNVYAGYGQCPGDSGSPVGTVSRGEFTVYGMHLGIATDSTVYYNQPDCSQDNKYSRFIMYDKIVDLIGITGQH